MCEGTATANLNESIFRIGEKPKPNGVPKLVLVIDTDVSETVASSFYELGQAF
jgi:hypothetical protein